MTGDHKLDGFSTYPFPIFANGWEAVYNIKDLPVKGDIIIGNDVWLGYDCLIKNGVTIGNGAIVAGNPARVVKMRFNQDTIERLQKVAWWDWSIEKITKNLKAYPSSISMR